MLFRLTRLLKLLQPEKYLDLALFYISISCTFLAIVSIHEIYITFSQQYQTNRQYQMMFKKIPYLEFYKTKNISMWKEYLINLFPKILKLKILNQVCFTTRINNAVEQKTILLYITEDYIVLLCEVMVTYPEIYKKLVNFVHL